MAKGNAVPAPAFKIEPQAHISWPGPEETGGGKSKVKLSGDVGALKIGASAKFIIEGTVTGFSMQNYGCSVDLKTKTIRVDHVGSETADDEGPAMTDIVKEMGKSKGK